jgi:hypothetical protein
LKEDKTRKNPNDVLRDGRIAVRIAVDTIGTENLFGRRLTAEEGNGMIREKG